MRHFIRRNRWRMALVGVAAIIAAIVLIPAPSAVGNIPDNFALPPMDIISHCGEEHLTNDGLITLLTQAGYIFLVEAEIQGAVSYDSILFFINEEHNSFSYLTSKDKCIIDMFEMPY